MNKKMSSDDKSVTETFANVERSLKKATVDFDETVNRREKLLKETRDVVALSARTIVNLHNRSISSAKESLEQARRLLDDLKGVAAGDLARYLVSPESEFVEASAMFAVEGNESLPSQSSLGVSSTAYLLGLLDSIGELKRGVFNSIRRGNPAKASAMFEMMETLYSLLYPFAVYDNVANGVKRKLDVSRSIIEDTRLVVTEETRRKEFVETLNQVFAQGVEKVKRARAKS